MINLKGSAIAYIKYLDLVAVFEPSFPMISLSNCQLFLYKPLLLETQFKCITVSPLSLLFVTRYHCFPIALINRYMISLFPYCPYCSLHDITVSPLPLLFVTRYHCFPIALIVRYNISLFPHCPYCSSQYTTVSPLPFWLDAI